MESEPQAETISSFEPTGSETHLNPRSGLDYKLACDTIGVAIAKLDARRIQGQVENDQELVERMNAEIDRAHQELRDLDETDTEKVKQKHAEYMEICHSIPRVDPEILPRDHETAQ